MRGSNPPNSSEISCKPEFSSAPSTRREGNYGTSHPFGASLVKRFEHLPLNSSVGFQEPFILVTFRLWGTVQQQFQNDAPRASRHCALGPAEAETVSPSASALSSTLALTRRMHWVEDFPVDEFVRVTFSITPRLISSFSRVLKKRRSVLVGSLNPFGSMNVV